jgi:hypothetical protein
VRRVEFADDQGDQPLPMPRATVTSWDDAKTHSMTRDDVIPDTGADVSVLPEADCTALDLERSPCLPVISRGVVGPGVGPLIYLGKAEIDGRCVSALIEPIDGVQERIVGRDVRNQYRGTFDGPAGRVVFGA